MTRRNSHDRRRSLLLSISKFAGGNLVAHFLTVASGFLLARAVGPEVLGLLASITLVLGYVPWLLMGTGNGIAREVPFCLGKQQKERALDLAAAGGAWSLWVASISTVILLGVAVWQAFRGRWDLATGWAVTALGAWVAIFGQYYLQFTYRTAREFGRLAQVQVTQGVLGLMLVVPVFYLGFFGLCLRQFVMALAKIGQLWHWRPLRVRPSWSTPDLRQLMKVGLPIMFVGQLSAWWSTLNDTLVLTQLDKVNLGLNVLVVMGARPLLILIRAVNGVVYPHMTSEYARTGDLREALRIAVLPVCLLFPLVVILVIVTWLLAPPLVAWLLPKYLAAVPALQWSLLALLPMSFTSFNSVFAVVGRMTPYAAAMVAGVVIYVIALHFLLKARRDLVSFAQAMLIGRISFLLLSFVFAWHLAASTGGRAGPTAPAVSEPLG